MSASAGNVPLQDWTESLWAHALYVACVATFVMLIPAHGYAHLSHGGLIIVGAIGLWRYGWGILHFIRSFIYGSFVFPQMRLRAETAAAQTRFGHAYLLVTSFRIPTDTTVTVYRAVFQAALNAPAGATVVASIVEQSDQRIIKRLHELTVGDAPHVRLVFVRCPGSGKRDALANGFRAIARFNPAPSDSVSVIDGDSIVPADLVVQCAPFLLDPKVGALTTDEVSLVRGRRIFHRWYSLRFAQRHIYMGSLGLARKVMTLTGRMSMFRASVVCAPEFIEQVEADYIDHWRLGRFKFLTGDDKSTWFFLLKNGYDMLYIPDVIVTTIEDPPAPGFFESANALMTRWFGNMLRNNARALRLGPSKTGYFVWWTILDQRVSMWTGLSGLIFCILGMLFVTPYALLFYMTWVLMSRYVLTLTLFTARPRVSIAYPFLVYFNQIYGSFIKTQVFFQLDRQKWTRQGTTLKKRPGAWWRDATSRYMILLAWSVFIAAIAYSMGLLQPSLALVQVGI